MGSDLLRLQAMRGSTHHRTLPQLPVLAALVLAALPLAPPVLGLGCVTGSAEPVETPATSAETATGGTPGSTASTFENPGGMWMPTQLASHTESLKRAGFELDPAQLTDPTAFPLAAVVSLGGCSASFVSPEGLIITNHHCVTGYLQHNSTPDSNLLVHGYLAKTRADEKRGSATQRVYVTRAFARVTDRVLNGLDKVSDTERFKSIQQRRKDIVGECEAATPHTRCRVASYYSGAEFYQIEQLEIRDVRLVYAPHAGVGVYGGETDNWRWPRHTGDFSFLRAYVAPDGTPADYSPKNVPFKPEHFLRVASEQLDAGDFAMVAGYPGRTSRLLTAAEAKEAAEWYYPRQIALFEEYLATLNAVSQDRKDIAIKAASRHRGLSNYLTNYRGMLDGLVKGKLADERVRMEGELANWIDTDPERKAKYGGVLTAMAELDRANLATRERDTAEGELLRSSRLLGAAQTILKMAEERRKPDAERAPGFQKRDFARRQQRLASLQEVYDPDLDRAIFKLFLTRAARLPEANRPPALATIVGDGPYDEAAINSTLDRLYKSTKLGNKKNRLRLLKRAKPSSLKRNRDPFIRLALALEPQVKEREQRNERTSGAMAALRPRYIQALREFNGKELAPDANSTLRVTYGTVRGYRPRPDAPLYRPFTVLSEMVAKHTGEEPFIAPAAVLDAFKARKFGSYVDDDLAEIPIDFLADLDITGGNSGSSTLNARGELIGLVFDGNYEAMASDWIFMPEITRSIHVDIRYVLWIMDAVDHAEHLMTEMGVTPTID